MATITASYLSQLENKVKATDMKIMCKCGKYVSQTNYNKHILTKTHINATTSQKDASKKLKIVKYEENKELNNCCKNCLKTNIPPCYYIPHHNLCTCCALILDGGTRFCTICKQDIAIELMERPYLYHCKKCANNRILKPMTCKCGATISLSSRYKHQRSKVHIKALNQISI